MPLTGSAARSLRALAHSLNPVVWIGKEGVTPSVLKAVDQALLDHELIKVKVSADAPESCEATASVLAQGTWSDVAQVIGRIVVLYKPHPKEPTIKIPKGYTKPKKE